MEQDFRSWLVGQMRVRNLNQSQVARMINVAPSLVSRYLNHGVLPRADVVDRIARAFRVDVDFVRAIVGLESEDRPAESLRAGELIGMIKRINWRDDTKFSTVSGILRMYLDDAEQGAEAVPRRESRSAGSP